MNEQVERVISDWLIQTVPPEYGPLLTGIVGNYDVTRPTLIVFFAAVVLFELVVLHGVWRYFTR